jgi:tetratricopeptide (TPR) repeat protein
VVFGTLFFLVNILLLLQFIPVGGAIIADRYSYIAYFGLFFVAGWFVSGYFEPGGDRKKGNTILIVTLLYTLALGYMSNQRCATWYDATTLWTDEIQKVPERAPNAYNNLGFNYFNRFDESVNPQERQLFYDSSYMLLNKAIELQPDFANPYISLGELERSVNKFADAKRNYYKALSLKASDEDANAYLGLAIISAISRNFDSSAYCFHTALKLKPYFPEAHSNLGNLFDMMHQSDSALAHYAIAISQNADMIPPYLNRGRLLTRLHRTDEAMQDFERCLALNPTMGEVYYARAFAYAQKHNNAAAAQDVEKAISLGYTQIDNNFYQAMKGGK